MGNDDPRGLEAKINLQRGGNTGYPDLVTIVSSNSPHNIN